MPKVRCPWHEDARPSLEVYVDGVFCFVCGATKTVQDYEKATGLTPLPSVQAKRPPADIGKAVGYIQQLPKVQLRGLEFHADTDSYYVVWPGGTYYLRRSLDPLHVPKYVGPAGHSRPLFVQDAGIKGKTLLIVEGEINAMSLGQAFKGEFGIVSPGAATQFYANSDHVPYYLRYDRQVIIADEDRAGALACINLAGLLHQSKNAQCVLMRKQKDGGSGDCNEILQSRGPQGLREEILKLVGNKT